MKKDLPSVFANKIDKKIENNKTYCVSKNEEKIDGCCATFRVLAPNTDETEAATIPYVATNSFFTMNLECVCVLRCLNDTFVECI